MSMLHQAERYPCRAIPSKTSRYRGSRRGRSISECLADPAWYSERSDAKGNSSPRASPHWQSTNLCVGARFICCSLITRRLCSTADEQGERDSPSLCCPTGSTVPPGRKIFTSGTVGPRDQKNPTPAAYTSTSSRQIVQLMNLIQYLISKPVKTVPTRVPSTQTL